MRFVVVLSIVAACAGNRSASPSPGPDRGRLLTAIDPDLSPLAKAAARALEPASGGKVQFAGVSVGGRMLIALSDTVARAIGAVRVADAEGKVPYTIGPMGSGVGAATRRDATYLIHTFRVKDDMAFVGADARSAAEPDGGLCVVLVREGGTWLVKQKFATSTPRSCGPTAR